MKLTSTVILLIISSTFLFSQNENATNKITKKRSGGRSGFVKGNDWVIPPIYDLLPREYSNFMVVKKDKKYGVIDSLNNVLMPFEFDRFYRKSIKSEKGRSLYVNYYIVEKENKKGVCDLHGNFIIPIKYSHLFTMEDGTINLGSDEDGYGIITLEGDTIINLIYQKPVRKIKEGIFKVQKEEKIGFIDNDEQIIYPFEFEEVGKIRHGHFRFKKDGKWGFMTEDFVVRVSNEYDQIKNMYDYVYIVSKNDKKGALNRNYEQIIPPVYKNLELFHWAYFKARKEGADWIYGVIDTLGNQISPFEFEDLSSAGGSYFFGQKRFSLFALYNGKGEQVIPPIYYKAFGLGFEHSCVTKEYDGKFALMNADGETITPFIYDKITTERDPENYMKVILKAERSGYKGVLRHDGTEEMEPAENRLKREQVKEIKLKNTEIARNEIKGIWYGIHRLNAYEKYFTKLDFTHHDRVGRRTIYYSEEGKIKEVGQYFEYKILPSTKIERITSVEMIPSHDLIHDQKLPAHLSDGYTLIYNHYITGFVNDGKFRVDDYWKAEDDWKSLSNPELYKKINGFFELEEDFYSKMDIYFNSDIKERVVFYPDTKEVKIQIDRALIDFGKIEIKDDGYVFIPRQWAPQNTNYSIKGKIKNIRYIDKEGKERTGDLDICNTQNPWTAFFFQETP